jgi:hypothetical protein
LCLDNKINKYDNIKDNLNEYNLDISTEEDLYNSLKELYGIKINSYNLVDLPSIIKLQKMYLDKHMISMINLYWIDSFTQFLQHLYLITEKN